MRRAMRVALVVSRFNEDITTRLRDGAVEALTVAGAAADAIEVFEVPGAFEIPWAARAAGVDRTLRRRSSASAA